MSPNQEDSAATQGIVLSEQRINELWIAQRHFHGGEPTRLSHLAFARAIEQELSELRAAVAAEAQPVAWLHQCRKKPDLIQIRMNKHEPSLAAKGYRPVPLYAAPQASEAVRDADHPVFAFLLGEGPLRGVHFGDRHPDERGAYWWRKDLSAALSAQPGAQKGSRDV